MQSVDMVLDRHWPAKLEGPLSMEQLRVFRAQIASELPSGTSVEITTFMNSATATVRVPGGAIINRTCIVREGFK